MSYDVPVKKYPIAADVDAVAAFLVARQSDSGVTNGGIVASGGSPTVPDLTGNNTSLAYMKAIADALMCGMGYQAQNVQTPGADTVTSTSFVNIFNAWTFNAPIAKTYLLHIDMTASVNTLVSGRAVLTIRVVVNGANVNIDGGNAGLDMISVAPYWHGSWRVPVALVAGNNTIQLQGATNSGASVSTAGAGCRTFTVSG